MRVMDFYNRVSESKLAKGTKWTYQTLLFLSGTIILVAMVAMVVLRYVFGMNLFGMDEIILCFVFWFYFFGAVNGSREDSQVRADVVGVLVKNKKVTWGLRLVTRAIEIIVLGFLIMLSVMLFIQNIERMPTTQGLKIPFLVPQSAIVVGFVLMLFYDIGWWLKDLGTPTAKEEE